VLTLKIFNPGLDHLGATLFYDPSPPLLEFRPMLWNRMG